MTFVFFFLLKQTKSNRFTHLSKLIFNIRYHQAHFEIFSIAGQRRKKERKKKEQTHKL